MQKANEANMEITRVISVIGNRYSFHLIFKTNISMFPCVYEFCVCVIILTDPLPCHIPVPNDDNCCAQIFYCGKQMYMTIQIKKQQNKRQFTAIRNIFVSLFR